MRMETTSDEIKSAQPGVISVITLLVFLVALSPIWGVSHFVQQDGSGHLYISYVMSRLVSGDEFFATAFSLNSLAVPNSIGHWVMTVLLGVFQPFVVSKVIATLTFLSIAVGVVFLRARTGRVGVDHQFVLFGSAIAFNSLWLAGGHNFIFGTSIFAFTIGAYFIWREQMTLLRVLFLSLLLLLAFIGHIVSFGVLAGSILILALTTRREILAKTLLLTSFAFVPLIPVLFAYVGIGGSGEPLTPNWRHLEDFTSLTSWVKQLSSVDPFVLISRRSLPFLEIKSSYAVLAAPLIWIFGAVVLFLVATIRSIGFRGLFSYERRPFLLLTLIAVIFALFGPDDFGLLNGSILRERLLICSLILFVPLISLAPKTFARVPLTVALTFVVLFQTASMWDFAISADRDVPPFMEAKSALNEGDTVASVVIVQDNSKYHSIPLTQLNNYLGINRHVIVSDNYEIGHRLFPVVAKDIEEQRFVFDLTTSNIFYINDPKFDFDATLSKLDRTLQRAGKRVDKLVLWGEHERVETVIRKWFDATPIFSNAQIRVFSAKRL